jgi:hypothetical protein
MHINRHHHAVSVCGEEISKGKLGSAIVAMDACNNEKVSDLNIETPDDIERNIPDWVFPTQQNLPTRHRSFFFLVGVVTRKSRPDGVLVMPVEGRGRHLDPKQIPQKGQRHKYCRIQALFCQDHRVCELRKHFSFLFTPFLRTFQQPNLFCCNMSTTNVFMISFLSRTIDFFFSF